jgi:hypothetical protein
LPVLAIQFREFWNVKIEADEQGRIPPRILAGAGKEIRKSKRERDSLERQLRQKERATLPAVTKTEEREKDFLILSVSLSLPLRLSFRFFLFRLLFLFETVSSHQKSVQATRLELRHLPSNSPFSLQELEREFPGKRK